MSCQFIHLLQVSKKCLWSLILYNFLHDLIHVYSPGAGTESPQGTKFWCQQEGLITLPIVSKKSLWSLILYIFFHDLIHIYSPRAGAYSPLGTKFWCQQKLLVTSVICCQFQITDDNSFWKIHVPPSHRSSTWNLTLIGPVVSEEKMFKECGRRRMTEAYLSYKLTIWAFGSGELKIRIKSCQQDISKSI